MISRKESSKTLKSFCLFVGSIFIPHKWNHPWKWITFSVQTKMGRPVSHISSSSLDTRTSKYYFPTTPFGGENLRPYVPVVVTESAHDLSRSNTLRTKNRFSHRFHPPPEDSRECDLSMIRYSLSPSRLISQPFYREYLNEFILVPSQPKSIPDKRATVKSSEIDHRRKWCHFSEIEY